MSVPYKKMLRKNPLDATAAPKYYPRLITVGKHMELDTIACEMEKASSLTLGDIQSVLTNFIAAMRTALYNGRVVNIRDFGIFKLMARTEGTEHEEECTAKNIKSVRINFRASSSLRPNLNTTRAGDRLEFYDAVAMVMGKTESGTGTGGNDNGGGDDGGGEFVDPTE